MSLPVMPSTHTWVTLGPGLGGAGRVAIYVADGAEVWVWDEDTDTRITDLLDADANPVTTVPVSGGWLGSGNPPGIGVPVAYLYVSFSVGQFGKRMGTLPVQALIAAGAALAPTDSQVATLLGNPASSTRVAGDGVYAPIGEPVAVAGLAGKSAKDSLVMLASDHGVAGDGTTDDSAALNALLTAAAGAGKSVQLAPNSTVRVAASTIAPPSNTRLDLNGATLKSALPGVNDRLLTLSGVSNVRIWGGTLDGDKASYATATEQRHNLHIIGSSKITLRDVLSKNAKGDGIYVGDDTAGCADIVLDRVTCDANYRNGMSIIAVDGLRAFACRFTNTSGTAPEFGVDVEPNQDGTLVRGIKMVACHFSGNAAIGLGATLRATPTVEQSVGEYVACTIEGNGTVGRAWLGGIYLNNGRNLRMVGGSVTGNTGRGVYTPSTGTMTHVKFLNVDIANNTTAGCAIFAPFDRVSFVDCSIMDNTGIGVDVSPSAASTRLRFIGNTAGNAAAGGPQTIGLSTHSSLSGLVIIGNSYLNHATSATALGDNVASRTQLDSSSVPTITGSRGGNTALAGLLTALANRGFLVDSTTA